MKQMRTVKQIIKLSSILISVIPFLGGCSSKQKPQGFEMPPALREVFRGGELSPLQTADTPNLGMPNQYDQVQHVCVSTPIYGLDGRYVRTSVKCW